MKLIMREKKELPQSIELPQESDHYYASSVAKGIPIKNPNFEIYYREPRDYGLDNQHLNQDEDLLIYVNSGDDKWRIDLSPTDKNKLLEFLKTKPKKHRNVRGKKHND